MENKPIGVLDSGIGGISVLAQIIKVLPNEEYIYYADVEHVPYGLKTKKQIKEYVKQAIDFLISKNVKAIVIACNTATSIAIDEVRKKYKIPIIGIEPAAKIAVEKRNNKRVLLMATPVTVRGERLNKLLNKIDLEHSVDLLAMPELVKFAEKEDFSSKEVEKYILEQLKDYNLEEYSEIVLGCTHFPFFKEILSKILHKDVNMVDGSLGVAYRLKDILEVNNLLGNRHLKITYYYSGKEVKGETELAKFKKVIKYDKLVIKKQV